MQETAAYEIIGYEAELACFRIFHGNYPQKVKELAKEKVIRSNLRLVLKLAIDYHKISGLPIADYFSEGKLGLMEAFYKFDHTAGVKFNSYAIWYANTCMQRVLYEQHDLIRVPVRLRKKVLKMLGKGQDTATVKYGKLAENVITGICSIDKPYAIGKNDDDTESLVGVVTYENRDNAEDEYARNLTMDKLETAIGADLTEEEQNVIRSTFGIGVEETSLSTVADEIGTSKEWARRIKSRALSKLRDSRGLARLKEMV